MKANLDLDEAQMKVAAEEEKKRRRELGLSVEAPMAGIAR